MTQMVSILSDLNAAVDGLSDSELIRVPSMFAQGYTPASFARPTLGLLAVILRPMLANAALERGLIDSAEYAAMYGEPRPAETPQVDRPEEQPEALAN